MKKITYNNKQYVLNDPQYPVEETVTDTDMNEIKEVVNFNADEMLEENKKLKEQLERTKDALINITTEKSSNINVKDSSNLNAKIGVFGISEQETREGYNLLNVASSYEITGSKTVPISMPAGNYTIKADDITTDSEQTQFCFSFRNSSGTIADARISLSTKKITFALTREATSVVIYSGNSFNESQGVTTTYKNLMIYEGADDKTYEEYGASPSPEFPSEIENVAGNIDTTVCNKNLANADIIYQNMKNYKSGSCSENTVDRKECITFSNSQFRADISENPFNLIDYKYKANTSYTIRGMFKKINESTSGTLYLQVVYDDGTIRQVGTTENDWTELKIVTDATKTIERVGFTYGSSIFWHLDKASIFIAEGDITDYIQNEQQTITFPLSEGQKLYDKDYLASDGIHHVRKQIEFDGTEDWHIGSYQSDEFTQIYINRPSDLKSLKLCSHFVANNSFAGGVSVGTNLNFYPAKDTGLTTLETWKAWLSEQKQAGTPLTVEYELETEEIEPYTPEQQEAYNKLQNVLSYYNVTNVFTDNALLEFKYIADTQTWVLNKLNNINQELLNIAGGN